jgi:hypothetical protein
MVKYAFILALYGSSAFGQGPLLPAPLGLKLNAIKDSYRVVGVIREAQGSSVIVLKNIKTSGTFQLLAGSSLDGAIIENASAKSVKVSLGGQSLLMKFVEAEKEPLPINDDEKVQDVATAELESTVIEWDQAQDLKTMLEKQIKVSELSLDADRKLTVTENTIKVENRDCEVFVSGQSECFGQSEESLTE